MTTEISKELDNWVKTEFTEQIIAWFKENFTIKKIYSWTIEIQNK